MNLQTNSVYEFSSLPHALTTQQPDLKPRARKNSEIKTLKPQISSSSSESSFDQLFHIRRVTSGARRRQGVLNTDAPNKKTIAEIGPIPSAFINFGDNMQSMGTLSEQMMLLSMCKNSEDNDCLSTLNDDKIILQSTLTDELCKLVQSGREQISDRVVDVYIEEMKKNAELSLLNNPLLSTT